MDVLAAILKPDSQCSGATRGKQSSDGTSGAPLNSLGGGKAPGTSFQDRCEPIPGRCGANFLFATFLKTRPRHLTFASRINTTNHAKGF